MQVLYADVVEYYSLHYIVVTTVYGLFTLYFLPPCM